VFSGTPQCLHKHVRLLSSLNTLTNHSQVGLLAPKALFLGSNEPSMRTWFHGPINRRSSQQLASGRDNQAGCCAAGRPTGTSQGLWDGRMAWAPPRECGSHAC
jgi:hypothetical protein